MDDKTKLLRQQKIQELAYYKWQNAGSPLGRCMEFWLEAEEELEEQDPPPWANSNRLHQDKYFD